MRYARVNFRTFVQTRGFRATFGERHSNCPKVRRLQMSWARRCGLSGLQMTFRDFTHSLKMSFTTNRRCNNCLSDQLFRAVHRERWSSELQAVPGTRGRQIWNQFFIPRSQSFLVLSRYLSWVASKACFLPQASLNAP